MTTIEAELAKAEAERDAANARRDAERAAMEASQARLAGVVEKLAAIAVKEAELNEEYARAAATIRDLEERISVTEQAVTRERSNILGAKLACAFNAAGRA